MVCSLLFCAFVYVASNFAWSASNGTVPSGLHASLEHLAEFAMDFSLMPSEIARLVYGYFLEMGCEKTANRFLEESPYLKEFAEGIKNGYRYSTKINNKSLIQLLNNEKATSFTNETIFNSSSTMINNETSIPNIQKVEHENSLIYDYLNNDFITKITNSFSKVLEKSLEEKLTVDSQKSNTNLQSTPKNKLFPMRNVRFSEPNHCSPRRKSATPKRITHHNLHSSVQQLEGSSQLSETNTFESSCANSSPLSSSACESSEIDLVIHPQLIYDELLKCMPLQEKLANKINQKIVTEVKENSDNANVNKQDNSNITVTNKCDASENLIKDKVGNIEKDLLPQETLGAIINSIQEEPEFSEFVEMVIEKEIASTPFKLFPPATPSSTGTSTSSLNTPNIIPVTPDLSGYKQMSEGSQNIDVMPVVKNLLKDLKTPEKIKIHSDNSNKSILMNPVQVFNTNLINTSKNENCSTPKVEETKNAKISQDIKNINKSNSLLVDNFNSSKFSLQSNDSTLTPSKAELSSSLNVNEKLVESKVNQNSSCESTDNRNSEKYSNRMKPVFQNQHLYTYKFSRLKSNQKEVKEAINYCPVQVDFAKYDNKPSESKKLTTSIEKVENSPKKNNVQNTSVLTVGQEMQPIELYLSNWPSTIPSQQIVLPTTTQAATVNSTDNIIFTSLPNNDNPVFYLNDCFRIVNYGQMPTTQVITDSQPIANNTTCSMPIITINNAAQKISNEVNTNNSTCVNNSPNNQLTTVISKPSVPESPFKSPRPLPAILSKGKGKKGVSNNNKNILCGENKPGDSKTLQSINRMTQSKSLSENNDTKSTSVIPLTNNKINGKKEPRKSDILVKNDTDNVRQEQSDSLNSSRMRRKRKSMDISNIKSKQSRHSLDTHDNKIKRFLDVDVDKFLDNLHGGSQKTLNKSKNDKK